MNWLTTIDMMGNPCMRGDTSEQPTITLGERFVCQRGKLWRVSEIAVYRTGPSLDERMWEVIAIPAENAMTEDWALYPEDL